MGFAGEKLSQDRLVAIASALFIVKSEDADRCELIGRCPLHDDREPSFAYNYQKDVYNCSACHQSGDLVDLWSRINKHDKADGFRLFCATYKIKMGSSQRSRRGSAGGPPPSSSGSGNNSSDGAPPDKKSRDKEIPTIPEWVWEKMKPLPGSFVTRLIRERGWSQEVIEQLDLRLQTVCLAKDGTTIKPIEHASRVAIPVRNDDGALVNIRLYKPGAKVRKIISWGKGYGAAQLFPPGQTLSGDAPVILCEGEPDTICALSRGLNAITQTSKLVNWPGHHLNHFREKDVVIAYDADAAGEEYQAKAAASLTGTAKKIRCLIWPEFMGCVFGYWPFKHGEDLTDFFLKHRKSVADLKMIIDATPVYKPPDSDQPPGKKDDLETFDEPDTLSDGWDFFKRNAQGRWIFKSRWLAEHLRKETPIMLEDLTGLIYRYNGKHWEEYSEVHLEKRALELLADESSSSRAADAVRQAKILSSIPHGRELNDSGLSCLENGMLDIKSLTMVPHHQDHFATTMLPVKFVKSNTKKCDRWLSYLEETIQTPSVIRQAQEFAGYCLTKETRFQKCLFLLGPGEDGKSKFIDVLQMLVGESNTAAVSINNLEDQFYRSSLYNKLLNVSGEISKKYFESESFKQVVTSDTISAAFKNKNVFEFKPYCKMVFSGNYFPRSRDTSHGFYRRWLPIQFKRQFTGKDRDTKLAEKLASEISEIYKWALAGLHRLWEQGDFSHSDETDALMRTFRKDNNPVLSFIEDRCVIAKTAGVSKDDIFKTYRGYCDKNNYKALNRVHFFRELNSCLTTMEKEISEGRKKDLETGERRLMMEGIGLLSKLEEE